MATDGKVGAFIKKLENFWQKNLFVCIGLDSDYSKIPAYLKSDLPTSQSIFKFNKAIIDETFDLVCAYKFQPSFYEAEGISGFKALKKTVKYLQRNYPQVPLILDAKKGDIANSNLGYVKAYFDDFEFDAITVNPYLGKDSLEPFLKRKDKGVFILVKTSNPGASEFQSLLVGVNKEPLYKVVAKRIATKWNENGNCCLVVGATFPKDLKAVRKLAGDIPILIPGVGAQGGQVEGVIKAGLSSQGMGVLIHSSRDIIFASKKENFAKVSRKKTLELSLKISQYLPKKK